MSPRAARGAGLVTVAAATALGAAAAAQTLDVARGRTLVVGRPPGGARVDRVDDARSGRARDPLPTGRLRTEWRVSLGAPIETAPLVDASGTVYAVTARGDVAAVARDGTERWHVSTSAQQPGPAALLSDDALVFADASGEAVAVRDGAVSWRARFGRGDAVHPAPLPLDDGGVVVATAHDLALLDAEGRERARTTLPEACAAPLVAALDRVVAVGSSGAVWAWTPGAPEPVRVGAFTSPIDQDTALLDDHTLIAVTAGGARLETVDLLRGTTATRAVPSDGLFLGPPAMSGGTAYLTLLSATGELAVAVDAAGTESMRVLVATRPAPKSADGGIPSLAGFVLATAPAPPLVDAAGTMALATTEGAIGVAARGTGVELLPDACAGRQDRLRPALDEGSGSPRVAGLAPLPPGGVHAGATFVAACRSGWLIAVRSSE